MVGCVMMCSIRESREAAKQGQNTNPTLTALRPLHLGLSCSRCGQIRQSIPAQAVMHARTLEEDCDGNSRTVG